MTTFVSSFVSFTILVNFFLRPVKTWESCRRRVMTDGKETWGIRVRDKLRIIKDSSSGMSYMYKFDATSSVTEYLLGSPCLAPLSIKLALFQRI